MGHANLQKNILCEYLLVQVVCFFLPPHDVLPRSSLHLWTLNGWNTGYVHRIGNYFYLI